MCFSPKCAFATRRSLKALYTFAAVTAIGLTATRSIAAVDVTLLDDSVIDANALLFSSSAPYGRAINGVSYQSEALMTYGGYQYATWYHLGSFNEDVYLARRSLSGGAWEVMDTGVNMTRTTSDAHNVISMGISGDGAIHLSWDHHNHTLNYMNTAPGAATAATWDAGIFNSPLSALNPGDSSIFDVTYPRFVTDPASGDMYFSYRTGVSGNGNMNLAVYDASTGNWTAPHQIINGTSIDVNPYLNGIDADSTGRFHTTWTWRPNAGSSNFDIMYVYSDDGGATWNNGAGAGLGTLVNSASPGILIDDDNPFNGVLGDISLNNTLMNQQTQTVDLDGRVHVVMWHADDAHRDAVSGFNTSVSDYFHYYRDPVTGAWARTELPTEREVGSRPDIAYDADGNIYVAYVTPGPGDGGGYYTDGDLVIASASKAAGYTDWSTVYTDTRDFIGEPKLDQQRLIVDGVLSVYIQENNDAVTTLTGTPLHVLDFNINTILMWAGDDTGVWSSNTGTDWDTNSDGIGNAPFIAGKGVLFDDGASTFAINIAGPVAPASTQFNNNANAYTFSGAGIGGTGGLSVNGGGTVTLANGANTYSGDTQINSGTLSLSGGATIAASPHINVAAGGTFDVTAVNAGSYTLTNQTLTIDGDVVGNIVAANNSAVHIHSSNSLNGDLTVQSGSLITGAGHITGNLNAQDGTVRVGGVGLAFSPSNLVIDDFEGYDTGNVRDVASPPWVAHANTPFADIEDVGAGNRALTFGSSGFMGVSRDLPIDAQIDDTETATFFFRFNSRTDDPDSSFGLADRADLGGATFSDFEAQVRVVDDGGATGTYLLDARDGGGFTAPLATGLNTDTWYNVWLVVDQITDTYDVYLNSGTGGATAVDKLNNTPLNFRNGTTALLDKVLGLGGAAPIDNGVIYDDLTYFAGVNLLNPINGLGATSYLGSGETLTVDGDFTMGANATLDIDIVTGLILDRVDIGGHFTADGTLTVVLTAGAPDPQLGDAFDILDFASAGGAFDTINLPVLGAGLYWDTTALLSTGILAVVDALPLPGDLNGDGFVGIADLDIVLGAWNQNVTPGELLAGDPTGDGFVGIGDLDIVLGNWNASSPPYAHGNIPEPASAVCLSLGAFSLLRRKRS